jgi:carbon-monoxide dehydrogenase large subunit
VARLEDDELLRGAGRFLDDLGGGSLHAAFVRSTEAHGELASVDVGGALRSPGVRGAYTAADLDLGPLRGHAALPAAFDRPPLATDRVRFVGEPVAVVVAGTRAQALDAAEAVVVDVHPLPPVLDPVAACRPGSPLLFPAHGTNLAFERVVGCDGDPLDGTDVVVRLETVNQRVAAAPMEPDGCLAVPEPDGTLTVWASTQRVHQVRDGIARSLGLGADLVRVRAPRVGGGFGGKFEAAPEALVVAAVARRLGQPVKWVQSRSENLTGMPHGRGQRQRAALGLRADGTFVGLDVEVLADAGAYPMVGAVIPNATALMAPGPYRFERVRAVGRAAATTTTPVGAFRGAGRPEATALLERLVDRAAAVLGVDPLELRRRNLVDPAAFPHRSATGMTYDTGDYAACLDRAVTALDELSLDAPAGWLAGRGVAVWLDCTPMNRPGELASVALEALGDEVVAVVRDGANDQGQAHRTTWALLLQDVLGIPLAAVHLEGGDTFEVAHGEGTGSARSLMLAGGAVHEAATVLLERARLVAAELLEAAAPDVHVTADGRLGVAGSPDRAVRWADVVRAADGAGGAGLPPAVRAELGATPFHVVVDHEQPGPTFPSGAHAAHVAVDPETGRAVVLGFVAVDDCGTVVNPVVVQGQQHGGVAQGLAQALHEEVRHDAVGSPLTATFADYGIPSAAEVPPIEARTNPAPTPVNALGAKGIGQAGAIGSTVAVQNAVVDALRPLGVEHVDLPLSPERVWRAIRAAAGTDRNRGAAASVTGAGHPSGGSAPPPTSNDSVIAPRRPEDW